MSNFYIYSISDTANNNLIVPDLESEIQSSNIQATLNRVVQTTQTEFVVIFETDASAYKNDLDSLVSAHVGDAHLVYKTIVQNAINFYNQIMIEFAGENIALGITQAGKTKDVADYLSDVMRYGQSGSLYEVINTIDNLISEGLPQDLEPFVTESRMNNFKQKIVDYLS